MIRIASRDKAFANELARSAAEKLGPYEAHMSFASLARSAIEESDYEAASKYITQSIEADPTQILGPLEINQPALKNRAAGDEAILAYETSLFKKLAAKNEVRTAAAALQLQDSLRQIVALAAIDQWKAEKLAKAEGSKKNEGSTVRKK